MVELSTEQNKTFDTSLNRRLSSNYVNLDVVSSKKPVCTDNLSLNNENCLTSTPKQRSVLEDEFETSLHRNVLSNKDRSFLMHVSSGLVKNNKETFNNKLKCGWSATDSLELLPLSTEATK